MHKSVVVGPLLPGMPVYSTTGQYLGEFVLRLTDNPSLTALDLERCDRIGPSWYYQYGPANSIRPKTLVYGSRIAFSPDFGAVEQFLIKSFGDMVWINAPRSAELFSLQ